MSTSSTGTIDLKFRPHSYFWAKELGISLLSDIKGANRRRIYQQALQDGKTSDLPHQFTAHELSDKDRQAIGALHPWFLGGEYLPRLKPGEVEIARIVIASTTQDVICVYARPVGSTGKRIAYRIVDEYDGETLTEPYTRTSTKPLTLEQLVDFFMNGWQLLEVLGFNFEDSGYNREAAQSFITQASSSFYPEFEDLIRARIDAWVGDVEMIDEEEADEADDDDED